MIAVYEMLNGMVLAGVITQAQKVEIIGHMKTLLEEDPGDKGTRRARLEGPPNARIPQE